jgi:Ca2+:H+ antiporter
LSAGVALILALTYVAGLVFSLVTHRQLFAGEASSPATSRHTMPLRRAVVILLVATAFVALESEILVHATEAVVAGFGLSEVFLGLIVIPIIGNAAEHATAVTAARRGQTDLALHIALGSSTQVALFVAPLLVGIGVLLGQPMDLGFTTFEVLAVGLSALIVSIIALDGESHWFEGAQLLAVYALVAVAAWFI